MGRDGHTKLPSWRWEALRTTLWLVPTLSVVVSCLLFAVTFEIDLAAYHHTLTLPFWFRTGGADAGRQVLIAIAAAVITVIGVVFSITILALTLASQQFGPRMMRNFIRDIGNQLTLGVFVGTFVYSVLALGSITSVASGRYGDFVPHLSITVAEALLLVDLAVLIYFIHHIAKSIQLPEVIAGIARDLLASIDAEFPENGPGSAAPARLDSGRSVPELLKLIDERGHAVPAVESGYLQFVGYAQLVDIASTTDSVIRLDHRPGHFLVAGRPLATVWPRGAAEQVARALDRAHITGPHRTLMQDPVFAIDQLVEIAIRALSPAVNDTFTALTCLDWLAAGLSAVSGRHPGRGRLLGQGRTGAPHRVRPLLCPDGQPDLRQDPPGGAGDAGRPHPPPRLDRRRHGGHHERRAAPGPHAPGRHGAPGGRGVGGRARRPPGHRGSLRPAGRPGRRARRGLSTAAARAAGLRPWPGAGRTRR